MPKCTFNKSILIKKSFFCAQKSQNYWHWPKGSSYSAWKKILQKKSQESRQKNKHRWQTLKAYGHPHGTGTWKSKREKEHQHQSFMNAQAQNNGKALSKTIHLLDGPSEAIIEHNNNLLNTQVAEETLGRPIDKLKLVEPVKQTTEDSLAAPISKRVEPIEQPDVKLGLITLLKKFFIAKHIPQHIEDCIPDCRNQEAITYTKESHIMSGLAIFLMRMGSGNNYDESKNTQLHKYSRNNIAKFIGSREGCAPVIKTIEDFLKTLNEECMNNLMIAFFKDLQKSKFFKDHSHILPGDIFHVAFDCVHTHTYKHPHHADSEGNNDCPYCLKRVYNKATEKEKTRWVHNTLVASFVFLGHLKIPIYSAPLYAKQLTQWENASDSTYKQECEIIALKRVLPIFKNHFPRMKLVVLLDGLYANRPAIRIIEKYGFGYTIVRKEESFPSIAKACNERTATFGNAKNFTKKTVVIYEEWEIERRYEWFNFIDIGDENGNLTTNVLRLVETRKKEGEKNQVYKCEWLCSQRLSAKSCELVARNARLRWEIEDLFNSMKRRGFNLKHDYSRDPRSCCIWQALGFFAFSIFELFRFSSPVAQLCKGLCQTTIAKALQRQLFATPTNELFPEGYESKKIQFRYNFVIEFECSVAISYNDPLRVPKKRPRKAKVLEMPRAPKDPEAERVAS